MATTEMDKERLLGIGLNPSLGETSGGIALIVLSILALAKIDPPLLNAIAVIVAGIALLIVEGGLSAKHAGAGWSQPAGRLEASTASGMSAGVLAGVSGTVLGILAILGIAAAILSATAIIIFGAAVLFDFGAGVRLNTLRTLNQERSGQSSQLALAVSARQKSSAMLVGVGMIALGILALAGLAGTILVTVALLSLGAYLFLESTSASGALFGAAT
jgi:hypothetical protein